MIVLNSDDGKVRGRPERWPADERAGRLFTAPTKVDDCGGHDYIKWHSGELVSFACAICGLLAPGQPDPFAELSL